VAHRVGNEALLTVVPMHFIHSDPGVLTSEGNIIMLPIGKLKK
jgi:hypothetical protein